MDSQEVVDLLLKRQEKLDAQRDSRAETLKNKMNELAGLIADGSGEEVQQLRATLEVAKGKLVEQNELLQRLTTPPLVFATVVRADEKKLVPELKVGAEVKLKDPSVNRHIAEAKKVVITAIDSDRVTIQVDNGWTYIDYLSDHKRLFRLVEKVVPSDVVVLFEGRLLQVEEPEKEVKPGDQVLLNQETMQIIDVAKPVYAGDIAIVRRAIDEQSSEVEHQGQVRVVLNGKLAAKPEVGDRVVLDSNALVIGVNLGKEDERFSFTAETNVTWSDIGGLAEAKKQMIEAIELPFRYPEIYKHYGKKPIKGVLLYGPPGCGKTMLGKAAATALAKLHNGKSVSSGFIYVKGPEILDRFVGVAEATIRSIFQRSRKHKEQHGYPAVIFIDEADAILGRRGSGISSDIERTIVPQFLAEMDGPEETGAIVLLATNRADILDPAVTRDGRVDRKIKISRPNLESARDIFALYLKSVPLSNGYTREELAKTAALELFSEQRALYTVSLNGSHKGKTLSFTLGHLASGAMVAGVVDQATSLALHRDIEAQSEGKPAGMSKDDLVRAVECVFRQNFDLDHNDEMKEFVYDYRNDVVAINKLRRGAGASAN